MPDHGRPFRPPVLAGMFEDGLQPRPHKRARQTSRAAYHQRRADDVAARERGRESRRGAVLRVLAHFWNRHQYSPTARELLAFALDQGERFDISTFRPRLTELLAEGLIEQRGQRHCQVSGAVVHTWAVREAGSREPRL